MRKQRLSIMINISMLLLVMVFLTASGWAMEDEESSSPSSTIGVIDLERIKKDAPHFIMLKDEAEKDQRELAEYVAQVLAEHQRKINELVNKQTGLEAGQQVASSGDETVNRRTQELAAETQRLIDQKKQEIAARQEKRESAVYEEFHAVLAKVAKDKNLDCILLKTGFQVGGNDVTDQVLKTWKNWGLNFWQRLKRFFTGSAGKTGQKEAEAAASGQQQ